MKKLALLLTMTGLLLGCATGQKPVPVLEVCPRVPPLELDVPARDWQGQMASFLAGTLPMPPDYRLDSTPAKLPSIR